MRQEAEPSETQDHHGPCGWFGDGRSDAINRYVVETNIPVSPVNEIKVEVDDAVESNSNGVKPAAVDVSVKVDDATDPARARTLIWPLN